MKIDISYKKTALNFEFSKIDYVQSNDVQKLNNLRNSLDNIDVNLWKKVRCYINNYDFKVYKPLINRAFFKYMEIVREFDIFKEYENSYILHLCEAPGGFIQGTNYVLLENNKTKDEKYKEKIIDKDGFELVQKKRNKIPKIWTMSLNKSLSQYKNFNLPSYNKLALNSNIKITYGKDNTGNVNNWDNIEYIKNIITEKFILITADGGFDERSDFNNKELLHLRLILSEIYASINLQKKGGIFILKTFDIYTVTSYHLIYLLTQCYTNVTIYKPLTSRPTNSEKYIICKNFNLTDVERCNIITQLYKFYSLMFSKNGIFKLFKEIPEDFSKKLDRLNKEYLENQLEYLEKAIQLCNDTNLTINDDEDINNKYYIEWCIKYNFN